MTKAYIIIIMLLLQANTAVAKVYVEKQPAKQYRCEKCYAIARKDSDQKNPQQPNTILFRQDSTKQAVLMAAKKIATLAAGHTVIFIGQTPAYISAMLKVINNSLPAASTIKIFDVPCSGHPGMFKNHKLDHKDILTKQRELYYRDFLLTTHHFNPEDYQADDKIYLVDYSLGPSIACFVNLLHNWFTEQNIQLPDIAFIDLAGRGKKLNFRYNDQLVFTVDTYYLKMPTKIVLAFADISHQLRVVGPFNSCYWHPKGVAHLALYPRPAAIKLLRRYTNYAIGHLGDNI